MSGFNDFWKSYPRREAKGNAEKAWVKMECSKLTAAIIAAIAAQKTGDAWRKDAGQYIPHPATWLNRKGWEDEVKAFNNTPTRQETAQQARERQNESQYASDIKITIDDPMEVKP